MSQQLSRIEHTSPKRLFNPHHLQFHLIYAPIAQLDRASPS